MNLFWEIFWLIFAAAFVMASGDLSIKDKKAWRKQGAA
jgi:hypothetical protein